MSRLFYATQHSLGRAVVVKVLAPELGSEVSAARFRREIELTARLQHPNILGVLTAGVDGDLVWYAMPYVDGESLRRRIEREGPLPVGVATRLLREVADALDHAHKRGVVHRDVKPENILLAADHALLADFGIAYALEVSRGNERLTATGLSLGTPGYMAPEQAAGGLVDSRSDLYALALVGWEMLAGAPPFGGDPQAVLTAHLTRPPPHLRDVRPETPSSLANAIARSLEKDPALRFSSTAEFRDALGPHEPTPEVVRRRRPRVFHTLGGVIALAVVALSTWLFLNRSRRESLAASQPIGIAVLPLEWLGGGGDAVIADALHSELLTTLSRIGALRVVSRASVVPFRGGTATPPDIARRLAVTYIVEGSVRQEAQRLSVDVRLTDASTASVLWGSVVRGDASAEGLFSVSTSVARQVLASVRAKLSTAEHQRLARLPPTASLRALQLVEQAREAFDGTRAGSVETERLARAALQVDSTYVDAWVTLGEAFGFRPFWSGFPVAYWDSALAAAARARRIDALSAGPLAIEARVYTHQGLLGLAEATARQALRLEPSSWVAARHLVLSVHEQGRLDEAVALSRDLLRLARDNPVAQTTLGHTYLALGMLPSADSIYHLILQNSPGFWGALEGLGMLAVTRGQRDSAVALARAAAQAYPDDPAGIAGAASGAHYAGDHGLGATYASRALAIGEGEPSSGWDMLTTTILGYSEQLRGNARRADSLYRISRDFLDARVRSGATWFRWEYELALLDAASGNRAQSLAHLDRAVAAGLRGRWMLTSNPMLRSLRGDAQLTQIIARLDDAVATLRGQVQQAK